jgi:hypothetical protein
MAQRKDHMSCLIESLNSMPYFPEQHGHKPSLVHAPQPQDRLDLFH